MTVTSAKDLTFIYPSTPQELTLESWGRFLDVYSGGLSEVYGAIDAAGEEDKELAEEAFAVEQAYALAGHFSGIGFEEAGEAFTVGEVLTWYYDCFTLALPETLKLPLEFSGKVWDLPEAQIQPTTPVTFGQFIDSKVLAENKDLPHWQLVALLACIYLRPAGVAYNEEDAIPGSVRYNEILAMPAALVAVVAKWFEAFNKHLQTFTLFHPSRVKGGKFIKEHMKHWGWINFLKEIAKTKVFDIPASRKNSIDCAREANAFDVLMYASEDKDFAEARALDQEEAYRK